MISDRSSALRMRFALVAVLSVYALAVRVAPYLLHEAFGMRLEMAYRAYPWNFSPLYALAAFGGATLGRRAAFGFPLAVLFVGDMLIALLSGGEWGFYGPAQVFTYAAVACVTLCGVAVRRPLRSASAAASPAGRPAAFLAETAVLTAGGLSGAVAFFVVTNFAVWAFGGGLSRPHTPAGLAQCFLDALPFFRPTLWSTLLFLPATALAAELTSRIAVGWASARHRMSFDLSTPGDA